MEILQFYSNFGSKNIDFWSILGHFPSIFAVFREKYVKCLKMPQGSGG